MAILQPLRRGAEEVFESIGEGWEWLRERSASALTRFRHGLEESDAAHTPPVRGGDSWGLLASEMAETDDELVVRVEAPGLEEKDLSVSVLSGKLVVRGEKHYEREDRQARYHLFESAYGAFERRFPLPCEVDADRAQARYRRGVLTIRLPRAEGVRRKQVEVRPG